MNKWLLAGPLMVFAASVPPRESLASEATPTEGVHLVAIAQNSGLPPSDMEAQAVRKAGMIAGAVIGVLAIYIVCRVARGGSRR